MAKKPVIPYGVKNPPPEIVKRCVAGNIRRLRDRKGMTAQELADRASVHLTTIQRIEAARHDASTSILVRIQKALQVDWSDIFKGL